MSDPDTGTVPNFDDIKQALEFDPFTPPASQSSGEQGSTEAPAGGSTPPPAPPTGTEGQAPQPTPSAAPPQPGGGQGGEEDLRKLIADQRALIDRLQQAQPPVPQAKPEGEPEFQPVYNVDLPRELFQAMGSDDENVRYKAMDGLIKGVMNTIAYDTQRYVKTQITQAIAEVTGSIPSRVQEVSQADALKRDFYGAFPALSNPVLTEIVRNRLGTWAQAEAARNGGKFQWTEDFRNRAGQALHAELGIPLPAGGGTSSPAPAAQPRPVAQPRRASFSSGGNSGGSPNGQDPNPFSDVLF